MSKATKDSNQTNKSEVIETLNSSKEGRVSARSESQNVEESVESINASLGRVGSVVSQESIPADVTFTALDQYVYSIVQNLVDNVCLHDARVRAVIERHEEHIPSQYDEDDPNKDQVDKNIKKITLQEEISRIPLNPFPYSKADCPDVNI